MKLSFSIPEVDGLLAIGFDMDHYRRHNPDVADLDWHPLLSHFLALGVREGRSFAIDSDAEHILEFTDRLHCRIDQKTAIEDVLIGHVARKQSAITTIRPATPEMRKPRRPSARRKTLGIA